MQVIYDCSECDKDPEAEKRIIIKAEVPAPVIPNSGIASPSLVAYIVSKKYMLALPLNRQAEEFKRLGIEIPKQNLANWVICVAKAWLTIIWVMLKDELLSNEILHADESTHQVIKEKGRTAKQKSYMWAYFTGRDSPRQVAIFEYQATRAKEHPKTFLEGFKGMLHVDAYAGYLKIEMFIIFLTLSIYCYKAFEGPQNNFMLGDIGYFYELFYIFTFINILLFIIIDFINNKFIKPKRNISILISFLFSVPIGYIILYLLWPIFINIYIN